MADAVLEKPKIKDDEFDIHGDLAVSEAPDKSFVVLYDSSKDKNAPMTTQPAPVLEAPTLEEIDETGAMEPISEAHPEDAYIDDILSSDDDDAANQGDLAAKSDTTHSSAVHDDDAPIALSSEELDGILTDTGPDEEFHPDFPVDAQEVTVEPEATHPEMHPVASALDDSDDELPIALSDEDLDEILLEEEGVVPGPMANESASDLTPPPDDVDTESMELPHDLHDTPENAPVEALEEEGPIALSDDELDNILADAEAGHTDSGVADDEAAHAAPMLIEEDHDEILTLEDAPEITMIDDGAPAHEHSGVADSDGFFDSDEDEPITLSDEELDGILSSAPEEDLTTGASDEVKLAELPDDGEVAVMDEDSAPAMATAQSDDDEPIALSADELDGILMDAHEEPAASSGEEMPLHDEHQIGGNDFFDADDDEPIALSADELDGIAATAIVEDAPPPAVELPPIDSRYADVDALETPAEPLEEPIAAVAHEDDDGPIALSLDELDGIAADAHEVTPEAPMVALSPNDTGRDEPSLADNTEKAATVFEEDLEAATLIHEDDAAEAVQAKVTPDTEELKSVMNYLDNLLGELPDDVIEKFAQSEYFKLYQKIMDKLGL